MPEIVIPNRIERSSTAVLEAIAADIERDPLASDYNYMDDPYLIPGNNIQKRDYTLSKASGKKAAQWVIENFPDSFANELIAEPRIDAFMPTLTSEYLLKTHGESVECLTQMIQNEYSEAAWELYTKLESSGCVIPANVKQELLELLSITNGKTMKKIHVAEEIMYQRDLKLQPNVNLRTKTKTWKSDGPAMQLFEQMDEKTSAAYNAIIQGMSRYGANEDARELYNIMFDEKKEIDEETFNSLISGIGVINEDSDTKWDMILKYLKDMQYLNVQPSIQTFNSALNSVLLFGRWRRNRPVTQEILGEMKALNIEPSLGTWALVLRIFYYTDTQSSPIIHAILDAVQSHGPYTLQDMRDFDFFSTCMNKIYNNLKDVDLAKRLYNILNMNNNNRFIGDISKESQFYNNYMKLLCSLEMLEETMEMYERCTPHIFSPHIGAMVELLNAIQLYDGHHYLPQIWSDLVLFDYLRRQDIINPFFDLLAARKFDDPLQNNCLAVAKQIQTMIEDAIEMERMNAPVAFTGSVLGNLIKICLYGKDLKLATYFYDYYTKREHSIEELPTVESFTMLAEEFINAGDVERFLNLVYKMSELAWPVESLIEKAQETLSLTDSQKQRLNMMK